MISYQNLKNKAAATNKNGGILVTEACNQIMIASYAPRALGMPENSAKFEELFSIAAKKLGYKKDRRCKSGWKN